MEQEDIKWLYEHNCGWAATKIMQEEKMLGDCATQRNEAISRAEKAEAEVKQLKSDLNKVVGILTPSQVHFLALRVNPSGGHDSGGLQRQKEIVGNRLSDTLSPDAVNPAAKKYKFFDILDPGDR